MLFAFLYFCEGAPIGFLWWVVPTVLRERGVGQDDIGALLALLVLPWSLKFLWAPLVDVFRGAGGFRLWIAGAQTVMGLTLVPLLVLGPEAGRGWLLAALLAHAVAAATQDVAIDALAIATIEPSERGRLNGWMQAGMLTGRSLFGGGVLWLRGRVDDAVLLGALVAVVLGGLVVLLAVREPERPARRRGEELAAFRAILGAALRRRTTWAALLFALTAGAGFEGFGAMASSCLVDLGVPTERIGAFLGLPVVAAMILGGLAGGRVADRVGAVRGTRGSGVLLAGAVGLAALAASAGAPQPVLLGTFLLVYLGIGTFVATSYALFMDATDPALGSTQFSAYMGATNLCESWSAFAAGWISKRAGYGVAFGVLAAVALPALLLLGPLRHRPLRSARGGG